MIGVAAVGLLFFGLHVDRGGSATPACPAGATVNVVAHQDDDLLFLSPDLVHDIQSGRCVRTVFVTAGDGGGGQGRWEARELGVRAAYARMAGANDSWAVTSAGIGGHPATLLTLDGHPGISVVFMRLPDGWLDGAGVAATGNESLQKLWQGSLANIHAVDGSSAYSRSDLILALTSLLTAFQPDTIRTQDYEGTFGDGDHSDHHATAYFVREAERAYGLPHVLAGYQDYATSDRPQNVFGADLVAKSDAFHAYLAHDDAPCGKPPNCAVNRYGAWLARQYRVSGPASSGGGGGPADLRLSGALDRPTAPVGDVLVWRLRVDDVNGRAAVGAFVDVVLPPGVEVAEAKTDRGPGCAKAGSGRLHCSLDYLSAASPVGNVVLITRVTLPGELILSATTGADGGDPVGADNTIELRANVPVGRQAPLTPPHRRHTRPRLKLLPSSVSCSVGADGVARAVSAVVVDGPATVTATARNRRTGRVI